jgi:hypothetical protein
VLERDPGALDLSLFGLAAQLPGQFGALGQAGRAQRVALGDQAAGGIDHDLTAEGGRFLLDQLVRLALSRESQRFVSDQLVGAEAVVQLADIDLVGAYLSLLVGALGGQLRHVGADDRHAVGVLGEGRGEVGDHRLTGDLDRPVPEVVLVDVALGGDDRAGRAVGGRRALQLGQRVVDHLRVLDVLQRVLVLELGVGVVDRVLVVLPADPGVVVGVGAVLLHVVATGVAEHLRRRRRGLGVADLEHPRRVLVERVGAVGVLDAEAARLHLLETQRQGAVDEAALDRLAGQEQRRGAGRAVVVDVDDGDPGQAELVERPLAVGRVAVAVARVGLLDVRVGNAGIGERLLPRLLGPVGIVALLGAGLLELGHADTDDERAVAQLWLLEVFRAMARGLAA